LGIGRRGDRGFKVENFDLKENGARTTLQVSSQGFHRKGFIHAGHDSEKPESGGNHHRHCGGVREVEGAVAGDGGNFPAGRELRGAENVASARRTAGGRPDDRCVAGPEQRDLLRAESRDVEIQTFGETQC